MDNVQGMRCVARVRDGFIPRESLAVYLFDTSFGRVSSATSIEMTTQDDGTIMPEAFSLSPTAAQELIDSLWQCGIRPSEGSGSAGQLAAVQYHLEDMRKLVFKAS